MGNQVKFEASSNNSGQSVSVKTNQTLQMGNGQVREHEVCDKGCEVLANSGKMGWCLENGP